MPARRPPKEEDSDELDEYEEAEALRLKTPSPEPKPKRRRKEGEVAEVKKKDKKKKKKHKEGSDERPRKKGREATSGSQPAMPWPYGYPGWMAMPPMASMASMYAAPMAHMAMASMAPRSGGQRSNIFTPPGPSMVPEAAPMIPTLHSVLTGEVQMLTPKGALLRLSDQSPVRYLDGLLRRRPDEPAKSVGSKCFVKVVRIEAGMVIVDTKDVDQEVGKDLDPEHEKAEVEEWVDVPMAFVGRVIGKKGEQIRKICDESGADLRFDEAVRELELGSNTKRKTTGGVGDDMRKFLEAAQEDAEGHEEPEEQPEGDDLRAFLREAQADAPVMHPPMEEDEDEVQEAAGDLAAFLKEAKAAGEAGEDTPLAPRARTFVPAVEFIANSLENWDEMLYRKMGEAGVSLVYPENLSIFDKEGKAVDIERGLRQKHFPIRVRYILTSDTYAPKPAEQEPTEKAASKPEAEPQEEDRKNTKTAKASANRKDAIYISGAGGLSKKQVLQVFKSKNLPTPLTLDQVSSSDWLAVFQDVSDAQTALSGVEDHGHGLQFRMATIADIRQKAFNRFKQAPKEEFMRLRINGDSVDVRKAKIMVLDLLDELSGASKGPQRERRRGGADGSVEETLSVPVGRIGHLIGKGGKNIQSLEELTGARLRVLKAEDEDEEPEEQKLLVSGTPKAVDLAKQHLAKYIPNLPEVDPTASGVPERRKIADAAPAPETATGPDLHGQRSRAAEVLAAAGRGRKAVKAVKEEARSRSSSTDSRTRVKRLRERKRGISLEEYQIMLRKQKELDAAAARAEESAENARAYAQKVAEEDRLRAEEVDDCFDWEEDKGPSALGRLAVTSFGAGRVSRVVCTPQNRRYMSFDLFSGGSLQVPEARALPWLSVVENALGSRVSAPVPWVDQGESRKPPDGANWVVAEAHPQGRRLAFRLVTAAELFPRFVEATKLSQWPRLESLVYLVELSTTPETVGHIMPFRHDYRKSEKGYAKGDLLLLEGSRPGLQDVGIVRKVLYGAKGEKAAIIAAQKDPMNLSGTPRLAFQRCGAPEKTKREQITSLERMVLPLLAARLPSGATALGVGASLDGTFLRFFVRLSSQESVDKESPAAQGAAAAAAAVGALLGCQTEVFASSGPEAPAPTEATVPVPAAEKMAKVKEKVLKAAKKKAKERKKAEKAPSKSSSSSSSESSSDMFLLAMAKRGDKALGRTARAETQSAPT